MVYAPAEDSLLLIKCLPSSLNGKRVLDLCSGSGLIAVEAAGRGGLVFAVDSDEQAVNATKELACASGVSVDARCGDLFESVSGETFDLIACNPPYLPDDLDDPDVALDGGPLGWEFIARVFSSAQSFLAEKGSVLVVFSTRTNEERVRTIILQNGFSVVERARISVGLCEEVICVEAMRS